MLLMHILQKVHELCRSPVANELSRSVAGRAGLRADREPPLKLDTDGPEVRPCLPNKSPKARGDWYYACVYRHPDTRKVCGSRAARDLDIYFILN